MSAFHSICQYLSSLIYNCLHLSTFIYFCLRLSAFVYVCLHLSTFIYILTCLSTSLHVCLLLSIFLSQVVPVAKQAEILDQSPAEIPVQKQAAEVTQELEPVRARAADLIPKLPPTPSLPWEPKRRDPSRKFQALEGKLTHLFSQRLCLHGRNGLYCHIPFGPFQSG